MGSCVIHCASAGRVIFYNDHDLTGTTNDGDFTILLYKMGWGVNRLPGRKRL